MLQTLFHIPHHVGGVPLFGFGLLLAIWAAFSVGLMLWLGRRQGWTSDTWGYVPLLALVGAIIVWLLPVLSDEDGVPIRGYGVMMLVAVLSAVGLGVWRARRLGLDADLILTLAFWTFVPGIIGARLFYVIEYWPTDFRPAFDAGFLPGIAATINVAKGGLVVFGSLVGAMIGLVAFVYVRKLPLLAVCDLVTPSMALGQALGRIGCLMNGCCFGGACDAPWAIAFPPGSPPYETQIDTGKFFGMAISSDPQRPPHVEWIAAGSALDAAGVQPGDRLLTLGGAAIETAGQARRALRQLAEDPREVVVQFEGRKPVVLPALMLPARSLRVHPTQVYSAIDAFILCLLLLAVDPHLRRDGLLFALGLGLHAVSRFLLEVIRIDESPVFGTGLSISQNISLLILTAALAIAVYAWTRSRRRAFWPPIG